jgi:hypothetical protein
VVLYSNGPKSFGADIGSNGCGSIRCSGFTTPQINTKPLYAMNCGIKSYYVGSDLYHYTPKPPQSALRSYAYCEGQEVRPVWKLLGYFEEGVCLFLENARFDENFCPEGNAGPAGKTQSVIRQARHEHTQKIAKHIGIQKGRGRQSGSAYPSNSGGSSSSSSSSSATARAAASANAQSAKEMTKLLDQMKKKVNEL